MSLIAYEVICHCIGGRSSLGVFATIESAQRTKSDFAKCSDERITIEEIDNSDDTYHPCPYSQELFDDWDSLCMCDEEQEYQCAMDV